MIQRFQLGPRPRRDIQLRQLHIFIQLGVQSVHVLIQDGILHRIQLIQQAVHHLQVLEVLRVPQADQVDELLELVYLVERVLVAASVRHGGHKSVLPCLRSIRWVIDVRQAHFTGSNVFRPEVETFVYVNFKVADKFNSASVVQVKALELKNAKKVAEDNKGPFALEERQHDVALVVEGGDEAADAVAGKQLPALQMYVKNSADHLKAKLVAQAGADE